MAGILSSLVSVTSVAAQTGYQQSTGQITQAFTMAFSWLPAVLKIKSVVFGVLLILFWIFLYNIILVGVRRWLVREGETTKMHKAIAGSLAGIMILSVFFLTKDPMGKAQQIAGSFGMFFAIIISAVVYFLSKSMIRNNTDGESGGFQSTIFYISCRRYCIWRNTLSSDGNRILDIVHWYDNESRQCRQRVGLQKRI
ncbi:hypothetical protein KY326_04760 [Candidatus Woesearchaeota archaeon]|nr:hypothetical protein [Candidatus Woesearchaeota archaeon]